MQLPSASLSSSPPSLQGLCLTVTDEAAASEVFEDTLAWLRQPASGTRVRFGTGLPWVEVCTASAATTLYWQVDDLEVQRLHLRHISVDVLDDASTDNASCLRIEAVDTGACIVEFHERCTTASDETAIAAAAVSRLVGIGLQVRAPERVAAHWGRIFQLPVQREAGGTPCLQAGDITLRFMPSAADAIGLQALSFAVNDTVASFDTAGLRFHLLAR